MISKYIILANGPIPNPATIRNRLGPWSDAKVIAADGGLHHAKELELEVDVLIGDQDSVDQEDKISLANKGVQTLEFPDAKDETDLELALIHAASTGAENILILGALGDRLDMSLANIFLLTLPNLAKVKVELWSQNQSAWIIRPPGARISGNPGDTVSLLPLLNEATNISTRNLAYPLRDSTLHSGEVRGISNVLTEPTAQVELGGGLLLVVHTPGRA